MEKEYFLVRWVNCSNGGTDIIGITDDEELAKSVCGKQKLFRTYEKVKFLQRDLIETIKELAETYHDREVMSSTYAPNQKCDCCEKYVTNRVCIEHDSRDFSKDKWVCPECYVAIATYWKEHSPKKICPI
jgi:hypothetical protein